jgi:hypothetical protein
MRKRTVETPNILVRLADLHKQATTERSHYYTAAVITEAIKEIADLRNRIRELEAGAADEQP